MIRRLFAAYRLRGARKLIAREPSPSNYLALAGQYVKIGRLDDADRVCNEALEAFPGNADLAGYSARVRRQLRESRLAELRDELADSPRPAVWSEYCGLLLQSGQISRAEEAVRGWLERVEQAPPQTAAEARLMLSRVLAERFLADRGREVGLKLFEELAAIEQALPRDARPIKLRLRIASLIGAWGDALSAVQRLLDLYPGQSALEARFRELSEKAEKAPGLEEALRQVERTGELHEDLSEAVERRGASGIDVRRVLREITEDDGIRAAFYLRGATALIQGPKGATAERTARVVRSTLHTSRTSARKLGLGQLQEMRLEGSFGHLALVAGERDGAALWTDQAIAAKRLSMLMDLVGSDVDTHSEEAA